MSESTERNLPAPGWVAYFARWREECLRLTRLAHKELREILRDRRTIVTLVLMPLLLYPLLTVVMRQFLFTANLTAARPVYRIGVSDPRLGERLVELLAIAGPLSAESAKKSGDARKLPDEDIEVVGVPELDSALRTGLIDVGVRGPRGEIPRPRIDRDYGIGLDVVHLQNVGASVAGVDVLRSRLAESGRILLRGRLRQLGIQQPTQPIRVQATALDRDEKPRVKTLATMIPLILILMTITGAVYPAIDLTAGERERNTLEILVAAPTPRLSLLLGKYAAVLTVAVLTATVNLVSMGITLSVTGMSKQLLGEGGLTAVLIAQIFSLMVLFAAFFSGMLLALCSFARSFKEAQAYLIPLMLVSLAPGVASLIPGIELTGVKVVAPLLNIVLVGRDLMEGQVNTTAATIAVLSTAMYALAAIAVAARLFGSEGVLYSSHGGWRDLFARPESQQAAAPISSAMLCLALLFPAYFVGSNLISALRSTPVDAEPPAASDETGESHVGVRDLRKRIVAAAILQAVLFAGAPLFAAYRGRVSPRTGLQLRPAPLLAWPAAMLIGISMWPFAHELVVAIYQAGWATFDEKHLKQVEATAKLLPVAVPYVGLLMVFALLPAISEEILFRGYVFSALRSRFAVVGCVAGSALLFGLFHFVVTDALAIERFVPSTLLGALIGWICWKSRSIFPGMLAHFLHNGTLMTLLFFKESLAERGIGVDNQQHLPGLWLAAAGVALAMGMALLALIPRQTEQALPVLTAH